MKKINFLSDVLPHVTALGVFLIVTILFFNPIFFKHQTLSQHDIQQWDGSSKELRDFRDKTGEEGLWASTMFSGMPAYLINVKWSNGITSGMKQILSVWMPHPINNIFLAFVCYYIMLLSFGIRPYLAITGAVAFGLSSFIIIGLSAGHNARIGAIAFMPLIMAGIHLTFSNKRILGFAVSALGLALHLRENHLQITYYLAIIIFVYGVVQFVYSVRQQKVKDLLINVGVLVPAVLIAIGTFFGQLWAVTEYSAYSIRGKSELTSSTNKATPSGLTKDYAFEYSNGILEPMMLMIPNFYGGSSMNFLVRDQKSNVYKALASSSDEKIANQLANYTSPYWGPQSLTAPYYAGAIICFLFAIGIAFAEKKYCWWLIPVSIFAIMLTWGSSFETFNYLMFDFLPGYNKFRSVTFALIITLFSMPLLGLLGLEKLLANGLDKAAKKKLLIALSFTGGLCLLLLLISGMMSYMKNEEAQLPAWFTNALIADRKSLFRSDAFRSLAFIAIVFTAIYFEAWKKITVFGFAALLALLTIIDLSVVDKRYFTKDNFQRKNENPAMAKTEADEEILKDQTYYRVYNLQGTMNEARTSYYHYSIGGYHGAKIRRYQDLYDSCLVPQTQRLINDAQSGKLDFNKYGIVNMLNIKYMVYGPGRDNVIPNTEANGSAWFVNELIKVNSANEELKSTSDLDAKQAAVIDASKFNIPSISADSTHTIRVIEHKPKYLKYESESSSNGLAVFSEIYYPKGWQATIDGKETEILRANYVLRALAVPAGKHTIEFTFKPKAYVVGNTVMKASSWILLLVVLGGFGWSLKKSATAIGAGTKDELTGE